MNKKLTNTFLGILVTSLLVFNFMPFWALMLASLTSNENLVTGLNSIFPRMDFDLSLTNVFDKEFFGRSVSTLIVCASSSLLVVFLSCLAAFCITRYERFEKIKWIFFFGYLMPPIMLIFPLREVFKWIDLNSPYIKLIIADSSFSLPVGISLMVTYFAQLPNDLYKTALIDGANWLTAFRKILIPQVLTGIGAVLVFTFILSWNDVIFSFHFADSGSRTIADYYGSRLLEASTQYSYSDFAKTSLIFAIFGVTTFGVLQFLIDSSQQMKWSLKDN